MLADEKRESRSSLDRMGTDGRLLMVRISGGRGLGSFLYPRCLERCLGQAGLDSLKGNL